MGVSSPLVIRETRFSTLKLGSLPREALQENLPPPAAAALQSLVSGTGENLRMSFACEKHPTFWKLAMRDILIDLLASAFALALLSGLRVQGYL